MNVMHVYELLLENWFVIYLINESRIYSKRCCCFMNFSLRLLINIQFACKQVFIILFSLSGVNITLQILNSSR